MSKAMRNRFDKIVFYLDSLHGWAYIYIYDKSGYAICWIGYEGHNLHKVVLQIADEDRVVRTHPI